MINVFYRISDNGYQKEKPDYVNTWNCLTNFINTFPDTTINVLADSIVDETWVRLMNISSFSTAYRTTFGNGAASFNYVLTAALQLPEEDIVYFVEDDYLHRPGASKVLEEAFTLPIDYVTLYDHPDKYMAPEDGGNPKVIDLAEASRVYLTKSCHWKETNSSTMTFAAKVKTLKRDVEVLRKHTSSAHPHDYPMFLELTSSIGRRLISPIPGYSTHGETKWLTPLINWSAI